MIKQPTRLSPPPSSSTLNLQMEKFSYNSYPDSAESSPRSRDVDFDNPPPWEDQQQTHSSYKVKFMCSYGGKIQPRPHDNQLTYVNGDTKILSVDRGIRFPALASKLSAIVGGGDGEISFKYQLPGEDLDALISVTNEDDLEHMMHEYDRLLRMSSKPARMRLFLFPLSSPGGFGSEGSTKSDRETLNLNTIPNRPESEKSVTAPVSNADFLFGSEKVVVITPPAPQSPPQQIVQDPQMFVNQQVVAPEQEIQRQIQEFQRIQIRDQELHLQQQQMQQQQQLQQQQQQQQEAMYRRKSEDGRYFTPTYPQNPPQPPTTTVSQTNQQPPAGYWQGNNNNMYTTTSQNLPEQQVYMIPAQSQAPGTIYHSVMRPPPTQGNQGYYPPVQQRVQQHHPDPYMEQQNNQQGYSVVQPPQPAYSGGPQVMSSGQMGLHETQPYSQMGNPVYYTVAGDGMMVPPPQQPHQAQYQGMGQPVSGMTGPDGKVVVNTAPKVSQSSDSV